MQDKFEIIHIGRLALNDYNIRRFEVNMTPQRQARFNELVASITAVGIIEPLVVRPMNDGTINFEIIAGERRFRAALEANLIDIPCMVRDVNDADAFDLMVIENLQRDDLTPFETASAFRAYMEKHGHSPEAAADLSLRTGIPVHAIRRMVRLLELPADVLKAWQTGAMSQSHAELFTRINDPAQSAELLSACLRMKLSTRDLAERIGAAAVELDKGFFDKTDCQTCPDNTTVQSGLFCDLTPGGKCSHPACFEQKQADFLTANWIQGKAAKMFGTLGFRFGHRLGAEHRQPFENQTTADRCLSCEAFISVIRVTGAVISGYSRTCIGPRSCFEELYVATPTPDPQDVEQQQPETAPEVVIPPSTTPKTETTTAPAPPVTPKAPAPAPVAKPTEETGPVFDAGRGERARKAYIKEQLMNSASEIISQRLTLLALTLQSPAAALAMAEYGVPSNAIGTKIAETIFEIHPGDLPAAMCRAAGASIMADSAINSTVWQYAADRLGINVEKDWAITDTYLAGLTKSEIVRIGEEPGVGIWTDAKAEAYRQEHHKGKALLALKKEELIDIILKSGAELVGRVPREVIGKRK